MTGRRGAASPKKRDVLEVAPERQSLSAQQAAEPQEMGAMIGLVRVFPSV